MNPFAPTEKQKKIFEAIITGKPIRIFGARYSETAWLRAELAEILKEAGYNVITAEDIKKNKDTGLKGSCTIIDECAITSRANLITADEA